MWLFKNIKKDGSKYTYKGIKKMNVTTWRVQTHSQNSQLLTTIEYQLEDCDKVILTKMHVTKAFNIVFPACL